MNPQQAKKLGRILRTAREARRISARELAERVDVRDSTIVRIEQGAFAEPSPEKLQRIARALGLDPASVYILAGYPVPDLPTLRPYLRAKYQDLPPEDVERIDAYAQRLAKRHGVNLAGPAPGEDERPDPARSTPRTTRNVTKKGGTR